MLKLIYLIIQQKQILKIFPMLILQVLQKKSNLASLKTEVYNLDINKLVPVPVDLCKLTDIVKNDVVNKTMCDKLVLVL